MTASIKNVWFLGSRYYLHFSLMSKIVRIERLPARYVWPSWFHISTEGTGVEILTQSGKGGEKNLFSVIFPTSSQTVPLPLSWFETHPRWPPVTQYALVGLTCEQSSPGRGVLPCKRIMGMFRWMGLHFHDWSDYNGVAFSIDLLEWGRKFLDFGDK